MRRRIRRALREATVTLIEGEKDAIARLRELTKAEEIKAEEILARLRDAGEALRTASKFVEKGDLERALEFVESTLRYRVSAEKLLFSYERKRAEQIQFERQRLEKMKQEILDRINEVTQKG